MKWQQLGARRRTAVWGNGTSQGECQSRECDEQLKRTSGARACLTRDATHAYTSTGTIDGGQFWAAKLPTVGVHPVGNHAGPTVQPVSRESACYARNATRGQDVSQMFLPDCSATVCGAHASVHVLAAESRQAKFGPAACKWVQLGAVRRAILDDGVGVGEAWLRDARLTATRDKKSSGTRVQRACVTRNATPAYAKT